MSARDDFMETYFAQDDGVTRAMVTDYLNRVVTEEVNVGRLAEALKINFEHVLPSADGHDWFLQASFVAQSYCNGDEASADRFADHLEIVDNSLR